MWNPMEPIPSLNDPLLLTPEFVAKRYGYKLRAIWRLLALKQVPGQLRIGNKWRIKRREIEAKWGS